jgi:hypothetical protein
MEFNCEGVPFMRRVVLSALIVASVAACSSTPQTTLEVTWVAPQPPRAASFQKLLLITVASNELGQAAFQDQMAKELKARGVNAVASGRYFTRYTESEKARFMKSIEDSGADFVLLARVTNTDEKVYEDRGMIVGPGGMPYADAGSISGAYARYAYAGSYVPTGAAGKTTTVTAEASIFAAKGEKLVWSARTRTTNARQTTGAGLVPQYMEVLLDAMKKDKLL